MIQTTINGLFCNIIIKEDHSITLECEADETNESAPTSLNWKMFSDGDNDPVGDQIIEDIEEGIKDGCESVEEMKLMIHAFDRFHDSDIFPGNLVQTYDQYSPVKITFR